jgi:hypothetical protein
MPLRENLSSAPLRAGIRGFPEENHAFRDPEVAVPISVIALLTVLQHTPYVKHWPTPVLENPLGKPKKSAENL